MTEDPAKMKEHILAVRDAANDITNLMLKGSKPGKEMALPEIDTSQLVTIYEASRVLERLRDQMEVALASAASK